MPPVTFTLLPAVDVAGGRTVRVADGEAGPKANFGDPRHAALAWQADGAEWIHLVDLDAAFGRGSNAELLASLIGELDVKVELSAGIRNDGALDRALSSGCERVILGTAALGDRPWCERVIAEHGDRIAVGLDVRIVDQTNGPTQHRLAARGAGDVNGDLWETLAWLDRSGCARLVVTDVASDGMLSGPNVELYRAVTQATGTPVIASGGIAGIDDLVVLAEAAAMGAANLEGSIVGAALYAGRFSLVEALEAMQPIS